MQKDVATILSNFEKCKLQRFGTARSDSSNVNWSFRDGADRRQRLRCIVRTTDIGRSSKQRKSNDVLNDLPYAAAWGRVN
jgi:hypothetical protein